MARTPRSRRAPLVAKARRPRRSLPSAKVAAAGAPRGRSARTLGGSYTVRRLVQMRALAHPLRLQLLEIFAAGECSTKQAAERLGEKPTRLYHHVAALERAGLIELRRTQPNRGTVEKYFAAVSDSLEVDPTQLPKGAARGRAVAQGSALAQEVLRAASADLDRVLTSDMGEAERVILARLQLHLPVAETTQVHAELLQWIREMKKRYAEAVGTEAPTSTVTLAFIPRPRTSSPKRPRKR